MATNGNEARKRRQRRIRMKISGTPERPRLNVFRSLEHIYAQVIDDVAGNTLVAASSLDKEITGQLDGKKKREPPLHNRQHIPNNILKISEHLAGIL